MARLLSGTRPPTTLKFRLIGIGGGVMYAVMGYWLTVHGIHGGRFWNGQPLFSWSFVAAGLVMIVVSAAPVWLIIKMTAIKKYQPYHAARRTRLCKVAEPHAKPTKSIVERLINSKIS